jgi:hypothetical protein
VLFHSFQCIFLNLAWFVLWFVLTLLGSALGRASLLILPLGLAGIGLWIVLILKGVSGTHIQATRHRRLGRKNRPTTPNSEECMRQEGLRSKFGSHRERHPVMLVGLPMGSREKLPNEVLGKYRLLFIGKTRIHFRKERVHGHASVRCVSLRWKMAVQTEGFKECTIENLRVPIS